MGIVLYFVISIKLTAGMRDLQATRWKKEIQQHTIHFYKESENYLALMDSKIAILKNLIQKAEALAIDNDRSMEMATKKPLANPQQETENRQEEAIIDSDPADNKLESKQKQNLHESQEVKTIAQKTNRNDKLSSGLLGNVFSGAGKAFMSMMGATDSSTGNPTNGQPQIQLVPTPNFTKNALDLSIGGNPLDELSQIENHTVRSSEEAEFKNVFNSLQFGYRDDGPEDNASLSIQSALNDLDEEADKVEKIVHLLKKGYSHGDISEQIDVSISEIRLIETLKLEKVAKR